jgi:HK97 gp10 family phage protein
MAPKPKVKFTSRFPEAKKGGHDGVAHAVKAATADGRDEAVKRIGKARSVRGYKLDPGIIREKHFKGGVEGGMVFVPSDHWYYRFFETGTVYIPATPFMRPANRKMRKTFTEKMGEDFEPFIRKRVRKV